MLSPNIDLLPAGWVCLDPDGNIVTINSAAVRAPIWKQTPKQGRQLTRCIASPDLLLWLETAAVGEVYPWPDKDRHWQVKILELTTDSGMHLWITDETETVQLKDERQRLKWDIERLDFAAQGANLGIWDFNPLEGKIIGNRTWATQKKLPQEEVFADDSLFSEIVNGIEKWAKLVHPDDLEATKQKIQDHVDGKTDVYHAEFRVKCGDGSWKWILDLGRVFERDENGTPIRMNGIHVDVDKLKDLQEKLSRTKDKAEVANRAKSIFLANMSHELRTPLNAILGYSQLMKNDSGLTVQNQEYLDIINRSGEHLLSLINNVLDMSKIDAGYNVAELKWFNFREMVEEVKDLMQMKALQKQLVFQASMDKTMPDYVKGDAIKTRQVLINLIGNAIKFTQIGSVDLQVDCRSIDDTSHRIDFKIRDTGIGIKEADLNRIFQPFEQVASASTQNGTGLGLSISKQFVELMGGKLKVSSQDGQGSIFRFSLDLETSAYMDSSSTQKEKAPKVSQLKQGVNSPRILIAEDQTDNQALLMDLLTNAGFTVKLARDGEEAVALYQSWQPDFIWMDRRMPRMDGMEATKAIRKLQGDHPVKIVALTASVFNDEIEEMLKAGMDDFARKPYLAQDLFALMKKHLDIDYEYLETQPVEQKQGEAQLTVLKNDLSQEQMRLIISAVEKGDQQELFTCFEQWIETEDVHDQLIDMVESYQFDELYELFNH